MRPPPVPPYEDRCRPFSFIAPADSGSEQRSGGLRLTLFVVHRLLTLLLVAAWANPASGQPAASHLSAPAATGQTLVARALANELHAAEDATHPMRYLLRKSTPRLTTTKEIVETTDGAVARLMAVNDQPPSPADEAGDVARLNALLADPARQQRRKQAEDLDTGRVREILRALPSAFLYRDAGPADGPAGKVERFTFQPNPAFNPPDLETEILTAMSGEIWIDPVHLRVARLEGRLDRDVNFGWSILGRLNKGGWIAIDQADVGPINVGPINVGPSNVGPNNVAPNVGQDKRSGQWRIVRFQMHMSGRVVFKNRVFDTTEEESHYVPLPAVIGYRQAIAMLLDEKEPLSVNYRLRMRHCPRNDSLAPFAENCRPSAHTENMPRPTNRQPCCVPFRNPPSADVKAPLTARRKRASQIPSTIYETNDAESKRKNMFSPESSVNQPKNPKIILPIFAFTRINAVHEQPFELPPRASSFERETFTIQPRFNGLSSTDTKKRPRHLPRPLVCC